MANMMTEALELVNSWGVKPRPHLQSSQNGYNYVRKWNEIKK
jgi:hypothetical protein